ncbi:ABC transporter permease [Thalassotalea sediminis]|uniref:ABC transporter permease n=1 Tax=Thalassotalea sediminis TaxID=1759089 RepID=UPI002572C0DD|nr:FtsX-like permease family protein [Thalassotalea sediminis]
MFKNYLITAWRNILKNGVFSVINIFGLTLALMSCILIMLFVREESGYDQWLTDHDRIVRMHTAYTMPNQPPFLTVRSAGRMMEAIRDFAQNEIETGTRIIQYGTTIQHQGNGFSEQASMVDASFFDVFDLPFIHGDISNAFAKPMDLVITEEMAQKYFGKTDVVGETLTFCCLDSQTITLKVTGVIQSLPEASHLDINFLVYLNPALFGENDNTLNTWTSLNVYTYFKLNKGVPPSQLRERIYYWLNNESPFVDLLKQFLGEKAEGKKVTEFTNLNVMPVADLHLEAKKDAGNLGDMTPMGDKTMIQTFSLVAFLVLVIACINFMNLATAKASKRAKEVAMRKVLGASRKQVAMQFLSEAIAIVFIALILAIAFAELVLPIYNDIIGKQLHLALFNDPTLFAALIMVALIVGIGAGIYPALYLSKFLPGHILQASKSSESAKSSKFRNILVVGQFSASIILVIATLVVYGQTLYTNAVDVGYRYHDKLVLNVRAAGDQVDALKQELLRLPEVKAVALSSESPTQDNENNRQFTLVDVNEMGQKVEPLFFNYHHMDEDFFPSYGVKPIAGRLFDKTYGTDEVKPIETGSEERGRASVIINQTALGKLGFTKAENAIGKTLATQSHDLTIIGVIPDIHFRSIKFGIRASVYMLNPRRFSVANITFDTNDTAALMQDVEQIWKKHVSMQPINSEFLSEMMLAQYQDEITTAQLFLVFSILAIIVACLGLYGLSAFTVERKTKEIGIRKVMGASMMDIIKLLVWQFSKPVLLANLVAWPIALYFMLDWLQTFPYRIDYWWLLPICIMVGVISLLIAWGTVAGNAAKVARRNPVHALRYE